LTGAAPIADMIVEDLIDQFPAVVSTFVQHRMQCVGCPMARFETVAEVCEIYRLPVGAFLADLASRTGDADPEAVPIVDAT
jgi:hybrid cluster-associated redox disulfide protein